MKLLKYILTTLLTIVGIIFFYTLMFTTITLYASKMYVEFGLCAFIVIFIFLAIIKYE